MNQNAKHNAEHMPKSSVERGVQLEISSDTGRTFEDSGYCKFIYYVYL